MQHQRPCLAFGVSLRSGGGLLDIARGAHRRYLLLRPRSPSRGYARRFTPASLHMLWVKAFHIIFVVTWFAGLFYLPRLFVYHADLPATDTEGQARFRVMEGRLLGITHIGGALAVGFGLWMLMGWRGALLGAAWFHAKLALVVLLLGYHHACWRIVRRFSQGENQRSARFYRLFNEVPAVLLIGIVLLAVLKPA